MPLETQEIVQAKSVIDASTGVADFKSRAAASAVRWWRAERVQRVELKKHAQAKFTDRPKNTLDDVAEWVNQFCTPVSGNTANPWINNNLAADGKNRAHWLRYYLMECVLMPNVPDAVTDVLGALLVKPPKGELELKCVSLDSIDPGRYRDMLTSLLRAGFDYLPANERQFAGRDTSDIHLMDFLRKTEGEAKYTFCWRSDSREYGKIEEDDGFLAKGRAKGYAKANNMTERWHPFSDPTVSGYQWFRKGQKDNCLYSVVSIGTGDWKTYLPFPLLRDHKSWAVTDREVRAKIDGKPRKITLGVSETWLYLFVLSNLILADTEAIQRYKQGKAYPEIGSAGIPLENVYGGIRFIRIHHQKKADATDGHGFSAYPVGEQMTLKHIFTIKERWGDGYTKIREAYFDVYRSDIVHAHWTPTGVATLEPSFEVDGKNVELTASSFLGLA